MKNPVLPEPTRMAFLSRRGIIAVVRPGADRRPEPFVAVMDDGRIIGFNGHVDLGTGIRTSLAQIIAEELDVPFTAVEMMLGDTEWAPDQGATTASETIQVTAVPLRRAAAQMRRALIGLAAEHLAVAVDRLDADGGQIVERGGSNRSVSFAELVAGQTLLLMLDLETPVKDPATYRIVGTSTPRVDIPAKALGEQVFVHDVRLPGMAHGRVVRPPYAGRDGGAFVGTSLVAVDEGSISHIPGILAVVVIGDFVGIVAEREEQAEAAMRALVVDWGPFGAMPDLNRPEQAIRENLRTTRKLVNDGDVDAALQNAAVRMPRTYVWPYQMHGSIGPCCSVAAFDEGGRLTVWTGTQTQHMLRTDLAMLLDMDEGSIDIIRMEASGSYGRSGMDDVGGDAALLARAVGRPVRVQLTRDQEHMWEPKGTAQLMEVDGGLDEQGNPVAYDYQSSYPSNLSPMLPLLLTGRLAPVPDVQTGGDRTAVPPYAYPNLRIAIHDMPPLARAAFFRGVSAMPTSFAHESYIDELAVEAGVDPVEYRLRYMRDERAAALSRAVAERAGWEPHTDARQQVVSGDIVKGQGFAYAVYVHGPWPGKAAAWAAWVADVEVDRATGEVAVTRVVVGQDSGLVINPDGVRHQIQGNVIQSTSRVLKEAVDFDERGVVSRDWGTYPLLKFPELPRIDVVMIPRPESPPLGAGESASVPSAAAIANAVYDATGVRFRELPLTPERVKAALLEQEGRKAETPPEPPVAEDGPRRGFRWKEVAAAGAALLTAGWTLWPAKPAIAPVAPPAVSLYSAETIERGRLVAASGDCVVCHTVDGGAANAGGRGMETPFGTIYTTNITPDPLTGIGNWSYAAFERAMRHGISRDGRHLYPAFPYTSFTRIDDADMQALYAWLMTQQPVRSQPPRNDLSFPFNIRPLLAAWNGIYLKPGAYQAEPDRSAEWNRGAYLVEGAGHCTACHSPRDALGAERQGADRFAGAMVDGWEAPPLGTHSRSPVPWSEDALYTYLRTGASDLHGPAAGPMMPVVHGLKALPDSDIRAMAHYLASLAPPAPDDAELQRQADMLARASEQASRPVADPGARIYDGACAVCHAPSAPDLFGARLPLALNSNVHSARPDNLIRVILEGHADLQNGARGAMPAFRHHYDDRQVAALVAFLRRSHAPGKPAWTRLEQDVARIRAESAAHASSPR